MSHVAAMCVIGVAVFAGCNRGSKSEGERVRVREYLELRGELTLSNSDLLALQAAD